MYFSWSSFESARFSSAVFIDGVFYLHSSTLLIIEQEQKTLIVYTVAGYAKHILNDD